MGKAIMLMKYNLKKSNLIMTTMANQKEAMTQLMKFI
jgi:hypothetical protein